VLEEVGSIAGVTSLSPATVAVYAPQEGTSTNYTALADAPSVLFSDLDPEPKVGLTAQFIRISRPRREPCDSCACIGARATLMYLPGRRWLLTLDGRSL